jgi:hypothetical protein
MVCCGFTAPGRGAKAFTHDRRTNEFFLFTEPIFHGAVIGHY